MIYCGGYNNKYPMKVPKIYGRLILLFLNIYRNNSICNAGSILFSAVTEYIFKWTLLTCVLFAKYPLNGCRPGFKLCNIAERTIRISETPDFTHLSMTNVLICMADHVVLQWNRTDWCLVNGVVMCLCYSHLELAITSSSLQICLCA